MESSVFPITLIVVVVLVILPFIVRLARNAWSVSRWWEVERARHASALKPIPPVAVWTQPPGGSPAGSSSARQETKELAEPGKSLGPADPRRIGRYRLLRRLGEGGFGTVFLGIDGTGRRVAIKMILPEYVADSDRRERFRREAARAKRVPLHSTAEVLDFDDGPRPYLVTEFIDGPTLTSYVRSNGPMRGSDLEQLAISVATALKAIHSAGIIHRDLKPANVLLSATGARVIDFGISWALDASSDVSRGTTKAGTYGYMAPEQFDDRPVSVKTDVFAWGALVAFAGTGAPPFGGGSAPAVMNRTLEKDPVLTGLDSRLMPLVLRALEKDPRRRPEVDGLLAVLNRAR